MPHEAVSSTDVFKKDILRGQVVFATGAGTGINYGIVKTFMNHGANAFIIGRRENVITEAAATLSKETGSQCVGMSADVRKAETLERAVAECIKRFGRIDHVILGAAGNFLQLLEGISVNAFSNVVAIDLIGSYSAFKATIEHVLKAQGSYISISATLHYTGLPLQGPASAAKAGVDALSRVIAVEYGPRGVRSNVIAPGPIAGTVGMEKLGRRVDGDERDPVTIVPTQRYGDVRDIGNAALFLASPAGSFINGTEIVVDGGSWHTSAAGLGGMYPDVVKLDPAIFRGDSKL